MENTLVSARVPKAKKDEAARLLQSEGSNMSELINDAINQLLAAKSLSRKDAKVASSKRDQEAFARFVERSTLSINWPADAPADYEELERAWRLDDYESLS